MPVPKPVKILKSESELKLKRKRGMTNAEEQVSYEQYADGSVSADGIPPVININGVSYFLWAYYQFHHGSKGDSYFLQDEQERYEWYCAGWTRFYDEVVVPKAVPPIPTPIDHKIYFFWDITKPKPGVSIYLNDPSVQIYGEFGTKKDYQINLVYTPPPAVGDPPTPPPPPPPSAT